MAFYAALEILLIVGLLAIGITQIVIPLFGDRKMFPMFRAPGKAVERRADVAEASRVAEIERQADVIATRAPATPPPAPPANPAATTPPAAPAATKPPTDNEGA